MAIDNAGDDKLSRGVDNLSVFGGIDSLADFGDFAILNKDRTVLDGAVRDGEDGGVLNDNDGGSVGRNGRDGQWEVKEAKEVKEAQDSEVLYVRRECK